MVPWRSSLGDGTLLTLLDRRRRCSDQGSALPHVANPQVYSAGELAHGALEPTLSKRDLNSSWRSEAGGFSAKKGLTFSIFPPAPAGRQKLYEH